MKFGYMFAFRHVQIMKAFCMPNESSTIPSYPQTCPSAGYHKLPEDGYSGTNTQILKISNTTI